MLEITSPQTWRCRSLNETRALARDLARQIKPGERLILLFDGEMGAGKTQFTRFLLAAIDDRAGEFEVTSPSFAIHNHYESAVGAVEHVDLFRLESEDDLESTGFWDLFLNRSGLVLIEWGCRLRDLGLMKGLPRTWPSFQLEFKIVGETEREIIITRL